MDVEFWASRVHFAMHVSAVQAPRLNSGNQFADDSDGDDDTRVYFPCPFCFVEIEVRVLCIHLRDEHCFDFKNAVCPLCAANLGKEAAGHFVQQHSSSLKRRKSQKSGLWTGSSAMLGKELSSFLGSPTNGKANANEEAISDPLLSPFLSNVSNPDPEDKSFKKSVPLASLSQGLEMTSLNGGDELDHEERRQKAAFVQDLIASMMF